MLSSCSALLNTILGQDECNYTGCDRTRIDNCDYCIVHCGSYNIPSDFNSKVDKSIREQMDIYRKSNNNK